MNGRNSEIDRMEAALKSALRREPAPEGMADRVLACIAEQRSSEAKTTYEHLLAPFTRPLARWAAASALASAMILGAVYHHQAQLKAEREHAEGEAAKRQLVLALRIAGSKLQLAKSKVNEISSTETSGRQVKE